VHDCDNSDGTCDANTMTVSAKSSWFSKGDLQATKHEDTNQSDLASKINMKLPDHGDRETKDHNISKERQSTVGSATDCLIFAVSAFDALVVEICDWGTDIEVNDESRDAPADGVGQVGPGELFELFGREEPHVEE
jgi:hypothetical protein